MIINNNSKAIGSKRLNLNELCVDMVLAKDAINDWGAVIVPKDTMLNSINFNRLVSNGIRYVYIKENTISDRSSGFDLKKDILDTRIPVQQRADFIQFETTHREKTQEVKKSLLAISDGDIIDLDKLYELTDGIMSRLKCKTDVFSYLNFLKEIDEHTYTHSNNVALLCNLFGKWLGMSYNELMLLTASGILHDIGKTKLDLKILNKQSKLTAEEFEHVKTHAALGYKILQKQDIPNEIKMAALMHHEKIDGSGYPIGLQNDQVNNFAKIVAVCDIYDAMTANRVYRSKICPFDVIKSFEQQSYGMLDTRYLLIFLQNIAYTYIGSWVLLSNGVEAQIAFIYRNNLSRPIVKTIEGEIIDLSTNKNINIEKII